MKRVIGSLAARLPVVLLVASGCADAIDVIDTAQTNSSLRVLERMDGFRLFTAETFDGNGRVCSTCHVLPTFDLGIDDVREAFEHDSDGALFRARRFERSRQ